MKNTKVLSLLFLLGSTQLYSSANNADLSFVLVAQALSFFVADIAEDNDLNKGLQVIEVIKQCVVADKNYKKQLADSQDGFWWKGKKIDRASLEQQAKALNDRINTLDGNIKAFRKGSVVAWERKKYNKRIDERRDKQAELNEVKKALDAQTADANQEKQAADTINNLIAQNKLVLEEAIDQYITHFGSFFAAKRGIAGSFGTASYYIASAQDQSQPITRRIYTQFVDALKAALNQFETYGELDGENKPSRWSTNISIKLDLKNENGQVLETPVHLANVIQYIERVAPIGYSQEDND